MFGVLNTTSGIIVATFNNPDDCIARVEKENLEDPEQIYTMVRL